jgi:hypothetical protein
MSKVYPKEQFHATRPGQTFVMEGHRLKRVFDSAPFLTTVPPEAWPSRNKDDSADIQDYAPATGRREMERGEYAVLEERLQEFAGALVGGTIFRGLYSLLQEHAKGRIPTFVFALRDSGNNERHLYEYVPSECAFVRGHQRTPTPEKTYLAGMECWGADLLAILGGDLGPIALNFGRARLWNASPDRFVFDIFSDLHRFSHPLRRPGEYLRTYRSIWARNKNVEPAVFHIQRSKHPESV